VPEPRVDDVSHSLRIFKPPSVSFVAVEIQIDVPFVDVQIGNLRIFLSHSVKPFYQSVG